MFSWFSKQSAQQGSQSAHSAPAATITSTTTSSAAAASSTRTAAANTGRSAAAPAMVLSPPRNIPARRSSHGAVGSCAPSDCWTQLGPQMMARTASFSSTDSRSSADSMISATEHVSDPTFSYAASYTGGRTSAFLSDDELKTDLAAEQSYRAARLSLVYNNDPSRNTLCPSRPRMAPASLQQRRTSSRSGRRSSNRSRMNAINEE